MIVTVISESWTPIACAVETQQRRLRLAVFVNQCLYYFVEADDSGGAVVLLLAILHGALITGVRFRTNNNRQYGVEGEYINPNAKLGSKQDDVAGGSCI
jgi:hypothetical protein